MILYGTNADRYKYIIQLTLNVHTLIIVWVTDKLESEIKPLEKTVDVEVNWIWLHSESKKKCKEI